MTFTPIEVDRENLTIMGVPFQDLKTLDGAAHGIWTNMYEGFVPTKIDIEIIRDHCLGKISFEQMVKITKGEYSKSNDERWTRRAFMGFLDRPSLQMKYFHNKECLCTY